MATTDYWTDPAFWRTVAVALVRTLRVATPMVYGHAFRPNRLIRELASPSPKTMKLVLETLDITLAKDPPTCRCEDCRHRYVQPRMALAARADVRAAAVRAVLAELEGMP